MAAGKAEVFATLAGVDSVFSLVIDKAGTGLFAGTGSEGKIFHIEPSGAASVYYTTDDPFVVSLALAPDGAVLAGTSGKGLLYRIASAGHASVLYDFPGDDVHAIATGPGGTLYAIVNEEPASPSGEGGEASTPRRNASGRNPPGPTTVSKSKPGKGSLWRFDARGRPERLMHHDEFHYVSLAVDERGTPYVGTGAEGRVYTVDDAHTVSLVGDTDERQVGAIGVSGKARFAVGSDPAVFHRVLSVGGPDAVWTSKALDAGLRARFGHLTWQGTGPLEVSTRSGDTRAPDSTWSAWQGPIAEGGPSPSPAARFVQVRARLRDAERVDRGRDPRVRDGEPAGRRDRRGGAREGRGEGDERGAARERRRAAQARQRRPRLLEGGQPRQRRAPLPRAVSSRRAGRAGSTRRRPTTSSRSRSSSGIPRRSRKAATACASTRATRLRTRRTT